MDAEQKTYFIRFIPVNEQIKDGDWYYNPHLNVYHRGQVSKNILGPILGSYKVQPSVCTYKISTADNGATYHSPHNFNDQLIASSDTYWTIQDYNYYRVLGRASLDAKWVKDGDEFDEDEINLQCYDDSGVDNPWRDVPKKFWGLNVDGWEDVPEKFIRYQLKGPCGDFH